MALRRGSDKSGSSVGPVLNQMSTHESPPTFFRTNKFTSAFQVWSIHSHEKRFKKENFNNYAGLLVLAIHLSANMEPCYWSLWFKSYPAPPPNKMESSSVMFEVPKEIIEPYLKYRRDLFLGTNRRLRSGRISRGQSDRLHDHHLSFLVRCHVRWCRPRPHRPRLRHLDVLEREAVGGQKNWFWNLANLLCGTISHHPNGNILYLHRTDLQRCVLQGTPWEIFFYEISFLNMC